MDTRRPEAQGCDETALLVDDFVDDRLDAAARDRFDAHLAGCESCRRLSRALTT